MLISSRNALGLLLLLAWSCNSSKPVVEDSVLLTSPEAVTPEELLLEERFLDTLEVTPRPENVETALANTQEAVKLGRYNPAATRTSDLLHTRLDLRFDWDTEQVIGEATLELRPVFHPTEEVVLDAQGFVFNRVALEGATDTLAYEYDGKQLTIQLDRPYERSESFTLFIDYIATPRGDGGSQAINSNQGLFFINADGSQGDKPRQIWTQGETEHNSRWFPTIDKPNERCTQETYLTVADEYETLSNGLLVSSQQNPDGTRTDYWKMDQPHAPYLFMVAVGDFAIVDDEKWRGVPVNYYVEKEYADDAKAIFPHTREMLTFFSDLTGVTYPWQKYSQIVVRDFVSGAMENTTAVVFGDFMQQHAPELIDDWTNEKIVAHELIHHWFGDYVTCESWANLTLNEGFANYGEYLWLEKKYGRDAADFHLYEEWLGYLQTAMPRTIHPLIHYGYENDEDMFDAHSYNKGGSVLHMLRYYLGDELFFAAVNHYLEANKYTAVEVDELRMAFEEVSGQDLHWFFDQWFLRAGHPNLEITYGYLPDSNLAVVQVAQQQSSDYGQPAIFQLPVAVDIYNQEGIATRHEVWVDERTERLTFPLAEAPALTIFDAEHVLLAEREENRTAEELAFQFRYAPRFYDRFEAVQKLGEFEDSIARPVFLAGLDDPFYLIRLISMNELSEQPEAAPLGKMRSLARQDPHTQVQGFALAILGDIGDPEAADIAASLLETAEAYSVIGTALSVLLNEAPDRAATLAEAFEDSKSDEIMTLLGAIYQTAGRVDRLPFFEKRLREMDGYAAISFSSDYGKLLAVAELEQALEGAERLAVIATDMDQSAYRRIGATKTISDLRSAYEEELPTLEEGSERLGLLNRQIEALTNLIQTIKDGETEPQLLQLYEQF